MMQNYIIMDKKQISEYFAPYDIDLLNVHHLYIEIDHESKTAFYELNFVKNDYLSSDYIRYLYKSIDIFDILDKNKTDKIQSKISDIGDRNSEYIGYLIDNDLLEYNIIPEVKDDYQEVLNFLNRNHLMTRMPKWDGSNYIGKRYDDYYILVGHSRDSEIRDESNYQSIKRCLENKNIHFIEICSNHWAVGWVEYIGIQEEDYEAIEEANEILERLEDYPIFDEEDYSQREYEETIKFEEMIKEDLKSHFSQNNLSYEEKREYCKRVWFFDPKKEKIRDVAGRLAQES